MRGAWQDFSLLSIIYCRISVFKDCELYSTAVSGLGFSLYVSCFTFSKRQLISLLNRIPQLFTFTPHFAMSTLHHPFSFLHLSYATIPVSLTLSTPPPPFQYFSTVFLFTSHRFIVRKSSTSFIISISNLILTSIFVANS